MTVRTKQLKISLHVILVIPIYMVNMEHKRFTIPFIDTTFFTPCMI